MSRKRKTYYEKWYRDHPEVKAYLTSETKMILKTNKIGVYEIDFLVFGEHGTKRIPAYVGETGESIRIRAISHLKRFFGRETPDYSSSYYWLGIPREEFHDGRILIDIRMLDVENDLFTRLAKEEQRLLEMTVKPYLQDSAGGKFLKYNETKQYKPKQRCDMAIYPFNENRRKAWEYRLKSMGIA